MYLLRQKVFPNLPDHHFKFKEKSQLISVQTIPGVNFTNLSDDQGTISAKEDEKKDDDKTEDVDKKDEDEKKDDEKKEETDPAKCEITSGCFRFPTDCTTSCSYSLKWSQTETGIIKVRTETDRAYS